MLSIAFMRFSSSSNLKQQLVKAAKGGRAGDVRNLLRKSKVDVDARSEDEGTPLHLTACGGNAVIARMLIDKGADINAKNKEGWTPLHVAVDKDHFLIIKLLLEKGANVHQEDNKGWTPLHLASYSGHSGAVRLLLEYGAVPHVTDNQGKTPLHFAKEANHPTVITILESAMCDNSHNTTSHDTQSQQTTDPKHQSFLTDTDESGDDDDALMEAQRDKVQQWLNDRIPKLRPKDSRSYASVLLDKGFDSLETLMQVLQPDDLNHLKTGHLRILAMNLKEEGHVFFQH